MEKLIALSRSKINNTSLEFRRYLIEKVNWKSRLIAIKGARGTGKTTLLLQHAALHLPKDERTLYVAMDNMFFYENNLYDLADEFVKFGGKHLLLDEVHKYPNWSRELKLIYDDFPKLKIVFSSSSILEIIKAESDLSRRAVNYTLWDLSLREFIEQKSGIKLNTYSLDDIIENHVSISDEINAVIKPLAELNKYYKFGSYPYYFEDEENYYSKLLQTVNLILDVDLPAIENLDYGHIAKLKKLLFVISESVPFTPNVSKLSEKTGISRPALMRAFGYLEKAHLIIRLMKTSRGDNVLNKPDKLFMNNSNLLHAISSDNANKGNVRETFFINQLKQLHHLSLPEKGDFEVDGKYIFEVGGKNKAKKQVGTYENAYIVKDDIESGVRNTIPLWLFGFMY